jgi:elongation factor G
VFENDLTGGSIPKEFIKPIEMGIREALERGVLAGYPMVDVHVRSTTAATTMSTPRKWRSRSPARWPFQDGTERRAPFLLEPMMKVEVTTPDEYTGDVSGDLSSRRGQAAGNESRGGTNIINGGWFRFRNDVRLRDGPAVAHPGPRDVQHALR